MRRFFAFLLGFFGTYFAVAAFMITLISLNIVVDRNGDASMGTIFVLAPICALIGGVIAAVLFGARKTA